MTDHYFEQLLVVHDYFLSKPSPFCTLSNTITGQRVPRYPVIRVYGSTNQGQHSCLYIHGILPYFFTSIPLDIFTNLNSFLLTLASTLDNAISQSNDSSDYSPTPPFVHNIEVVRATSFYGFNPHPQPFLKISLLYPSLITKAASLLREGSILSVPFSIFEAHLSFLSQFMIDCSLVGMDFIKVSNPSFRVPLPEFEATKAHPFKRKVSQEDVENGLIKASTLPKQSKTCLEVDVMKDQIVSSVCLDESCVPTLQPLWTDSVRIRKALTIYDDLIAPSASPEQIHPDNDHFFQGFANFDVQNQALTNLASWYHNPTDGNSSKRDD
ncbi:hypothetical protein GEMRC1_013242 [Eukaryota sp. GEM-RC1]